MAELPFPQNLVYQSWGPRTLFGQVDYHRGVDFARGETNVAGTAVRCVADGIVTDLGSHPDYQHYVQIEHTRDASGRRWWTRHHMMSGVDRPTLGRRVFARDLIGRVAPAGGVSTGVHHHFEVHTDDTAFHTPNYSTSVNPEIYIGRVPTAPFTTPTTEGDDMIRIQAPGRGTALIGPGYFRALPNAEYISAAGDLVTKHLNGNDRQFDLWRDIALGGTASAPSA